MSKEKLSVWGDEKINIITEHFGQDQEHKVGSDQSTSAEAGINIESTKQEWKIIKPLVVTYADCWFFSLGLHSHAQEE